jgi:peroxiredoxin 2/4
MSLAKVGQPAPPFEMKAVSPSDNGKTLGRSVSLPDYEGRWIVLFFYPYDFSSVCPTEIISLSDRREEFEELGAEIIGVSTDSIYSHFAWINTPRNGGGLGGVSYPLASDITKTVSRDYGVLVEEEGVALRGLFLIDPEGVLQYAAVNSMNVGRSVDETLRVLQALQTGGMCPSDWKPGKELVNM